MRHFAAHPKHPSAIKCLGYLQGDDRAAPWQPQHKGISSALILFHHGHQTFPGIFTVFKKTLNITFWLYIKTRAFLVMLKLFTRPSAISLPQFHFVFIAQGFQAANPLEAVAPRER